MLFGAAGVGARRRMHAIVTRSTVGLRALLQRQGIGFAAPLLAENNNNSQGAEGLRSMLVFEGAMRVHALFDFLLNRARSLHDDACDVPVLMAPTQFVGASMQRYTLEASSGTAAARAAGKAASAVYKLEVKGSQPVPAWVLDRVLSVMTVTQGSAGVTVLSEPATDTLPFNWQPEGTSAAEGDGCDLEDCAARQGGCLSVEEAMRWRRGAPGLGVAGIRELSYSYSAGTFTANKLTSRVAAVP